MHCLDFYLFLARVAQIEFIWANEVGRRSDCNVADAMI
ncbi:hypothetical protein Pan258_11690 [Symmachiella dynata]|nr:hypothetical protein Pan258_11690 [Symmachiella dynata]